MPPSQPPTGPGVEIVPVEVPLTDLEEILQSPSLRWRCEQFLNAGLTAPQARALTLDKTVDLHFVLYTLIGRGSITIAHVSKAPGEPMRAEKLPAGVVARLRAACETAGV